ncbi:MAG: hypothetical protein ACYTGG_08970 [Planctomycetota bacterium]
MTIDQSGREFSWRAHPARERGARTVAAVVIIAAASGGVVLAAGVPGWSVTLAVVAASVLVLATNRFFFPSRFTIDREGITARYPLRTMHRRWSDLRRFVHDRDGGYLSTRARASRLDGYQGMHILFGDQREAVIDRIRRLLREGGER